MGTAAIGLSVRSTAAEDAGIAAFGKYVLHLDSVCVWNGVVSKVQDAQLGVG